MVDPNGMQEEEWSIGGLVERGIQALPGGGSSGEGSATLVGDAVPDIGKIIGETAVPRAGNVPPTETLQEFIQGVREEGVFRNPDHAGSVFGGFKGEIGKQFDALIKQAKENPGDLAAATTPGTPQFFAGAAGTVLGFGEEAVTVATTEDEGVRNEAIGRGIFKGGQVAGLLSVFKGRGGGAPKRGGVFDVSSAVDDAFSGLTVRDLVDVPQVGPGRPGIGGTGFTKGDLLRSAGEAFDGDLTKAGRDLSKHPSVIGLTKSTFNKTLRTDALRSAAGEGAVGGILTGGAFSNPTLPRYGPVLQFQIPGGHGVRFYATGPKAGKMIGFIGP